MTAEELAEAERLLRELSEAYAAVAHLSPEERYRLACETLGEEEVEAERQRDIELCDELTLRARRDALSREVVRAMILHRIAIFRPVAKRAN
jgi:hypothetical protein